MVLAHLIAISSVLSMTVAHQEVETVESPILAVPVHYEDQAVIISSKAGVAVVRFTDARPDGRKYEFRFLPAGDGAKEETGTGEVFENLIREPRLDKPTKVIDAGSQLRLIAGQLSLEWSLGGDGFGWLYFTPEDERVHLVAADLYERLKLTRFMTR